MIKYNFQGPFTRKVNVDMVKGTECVNGVYAMLAIEVFREDCTDFFKVLAMIFREKWFDSVQ